MAYLITDDCIDCNACEIECPNNAIYPPGEEWELNGSKNEALNSTHTYIAYERCTECVGYYDEPQCVAACPSEAIIKDPDRVETNEELLAKKERLGVILK
ncbi:MAG TPA: 4Fe-4S dicluster domain-containing protein [Ignavibacteriaceae bacterium]|jgi:ferredoxin